MATSTEIAWQLPDQVDCYRSLADTTNYGNQPQRGPNPIFFEYLAAGAAKYRKSGEGPLKNGWGPLQNGQGVIDKPIWGF